MTVLSKAARGLWRLSWVDDQGLQTWRFKTIPAAYSFAAENGLGKITKVMEPEVGRRAQVCHGPRNRQVGEIVAVLDSTHTIYARKNCNVDLRLPDGVVRFKVSDVELI